MEVTDIPMFGRKYTWSNSIDGDRWSRIDRFLLDPEWLELFDFKVWGLPRILSNHCLLLLTEDQRDWGPKPFKFFNCWSLHPGFLALVKKTWVEAQVFGWAGFVVKTKFLILKSKLKKWNIEVFGNVESKLKVAEAELYSLDFEAEGRDLNDQEVSKRRNLLGEVWRLRKIGKWVWLQKSRLNWALKGDKNTRFFHVMAKTRQCKNMLDCIQVNGRDIMQPNEVEFTKFEMWVAVKSCDGNKAPGPDGFNLTCIQKCWSVMKHDFMNFMKEFHENVYKILSKVLTFRMKKVLPEVISENRSAFLGVRNIMDRVLIANEIVDWWKKTKTKGVILKLDFERAYDTVNWEYLLDMLQRFGFGSRWIGWIEACVTSHSISVLVNGSPTVEFHP
ncbi:uncharacterized protein LOC114258520 [Camellia sinensis]|uniref:uncharacterized protein LOC114258520 n=1 Tax=Camellia sinensis TaxID=4442 RepID=UPI0010359947|nr:uncharacterized protein LOC114258520 [Camellia sinensis]